MFSTHTKSFTTTDQPCGNIGYHPNSFIIYELLGGKNVWKGNSDTFYDDRALWYRHKCYFGIFVKPLPLYYYNIDITTHLHIGVVKYPNDQN